MIVVEAGHANVMKLSPLSCELSIFAAVKKCRVMRILLLFDLI
jgi:hypothetical protein